MQSRNRKLACCWLLLWLSAAGCAGSPACLTSASPFTVRPDVQRLPVQRPDIVADVSAVAQRDEPPTRFAPDYFLVSEEEIRCAAADNAPLAQMLSLESQAIASQPAPHTRRRQSSSLLQRTLNLIAETRRGEAAATALEAFLQLAEAESGAENLSQQRQQLDAMLEDLARLADRGLVLPVPRSQVEDQRLQLLHQEAELQSTIGRLRTALTSQLHVQQNESLLLWPAADLTVDSHVPDVQVAYEIALGQRADIAALELVRSASDEQVVLAARTLLGQTSAALGIGLPRYLTLALNHRAQAAEAAVRRQQAAVQLEQQREVVRQEIQQAIALIETRLEQIGITRKRLEVARGHLEALKQQQSITGEVPLNVRRARIEVLTIEQQLLHDVIQWKLAHVQLQRAQGLLARDCYSATGFAGM